MYLIKAGEIRIIFLLGPILSGPGVKILSREIDTIFYELLQSIKPKSIAQRLPHKKQVEPEQISLVFERANSEDNCSAHLVMHCASFYIHRQRLKTAIHLFDCERAIVLIALKRDNRCQLIDFNISFFIRRIAWRFKLPSEGKILPVAIGASMPDGRKINRRLCLFKCSIKEIRKI